MAMKMRLKMKNTRSQICNINRPGPKMCLSVMMVICIKQHLNNILSSIHEKVKRH